MKRKPVKPQNKRIPIHGSMTRPADPNQGAEEMRNGRVPWDSKGGTLDVAAETIEFTSNCPTTGQPDFYKLWINYTPNKFYIESKTLKFYLWSFRDHGFHCETLARRIAHDVKKAIEANTVRVRLEQLPRGGIGLTATYYL